MNEAFRAEKSYVWLGHWSLRAACRESRNPNIFIPDPEFDSLEIQRHKTAQAKVICSTCPVMMECREYAIKANETLGIWGGLTVEERHAIRLYRRKHPGQEGLAV